MSRRLVRLAGPPHWGRAVAAAQLPRSPAVVYWVGSQPPQGVVASTQGRFHAVLGTTQEVVVFDAHDGVDPDALAAAVGSLRGGGVLVLLTPETGRWPERLDPLLERMTPAGRSPAESGGRFLRRLIAALEQTAWVECCAPGDPPPDLRPQPAVETGADFGFGCRTADQKAAVAAIMRVVSGHRRRPLVVSADRGRGKSAAVGIALGELLSQGRLARVVVTAPRASAVETVFEHAALRAQAIEQAVEAPSAPRGGKRAAPLNSHVARHREGLAVGAGEVVYRPPERLVDAPDEADLVVVDEAAGLPVWLLTELLEASSRMVFATTVHGYEGSGRGFDLRFRAVLDRRTPQWRTQRLQTPIRWETGDRLEAWLARLLLLDADLDPPPQGGFSPLLEGAQASRVVCSLRTRDALVADEAQLRRFFGLLLAAHYRTRPFDLRQLLDAPGIHLHVAEIDGTLLGVAMVAEEGGLDAALGSEIWAGRRRPHGHLLPQLLATHAGSKTAPTLRSLRLLRIAVRPEARRSGVGSQLVASAVEQSRRRGYALFGSCFGATPELVAFWRNSGLRTAAVGLRRDPASGEHSVLMVQGLDAAGEAVAAAASLRLGEVGASLLGEPLSRFEPVTALATFRAARADAPNLAEWQCAELEGFAFGQRDYAVALPALQRLAVRLLLSERCARGVPTAYQVALIEKVLQGAAWPAVADRLGVHGRSAATRLLREVVAELLRLAT